MLQAAILETGKGIKVSITEMGKGVRGCYFLDG